MSAVPGRRLAAVLQTLDLHGPVVPLAGGTTGSAWLVEGLVVRLLAGGSIHDRAGLGPAAMADVARRAAATGVAPEVVTYLPEQSALVLRHVPGCALTDDALRDPAVLRRTAAAVRRLHAGELTGLCLDMHGFLDAYARAPALPEGWLAALPRMHRLVDSLADAAPVLCHGDPVAANLVDDGGRVWLIDLDDAVDADPAYDLGNLWVQAGLDSGGLQALLAAYAGDIDPERVLSWALVISYAWAAWARLRAEQAMPAGYDLLAFGDRMWAYASPRLTSGRITLT